MENLKNPFVAAGVATTLVVIAMYIDSRMNNREHERNSYIKNSLLIGVVVGIVVHFTGNSLPMIGGGCGDDLELMTEPF